MKRQAFYLFAIFFACIMGYFIIYKMFFERHEENIKDIPIKNVKAETLKNALLSLQDFQDSKISIDEEKETVIIDDKYEIYIKSGHYVMNIADTKSEEDFCKIVDAIEQSLGGTLGSSLETCHMTIDGKINLGGISVEDYNGYKTLSIRDDEPFTIYDKSATHKEKELIPLDKINYNIEINNYLFTSLYSKYTDNSKTYSICGNVYNSDKKASDNFKFKIYDSDKKELSASNYVYENDTKKYMSFCVDFSEVQSARYYSIEEGLQ